jgi:glutamine amidotransferase PdxT
MLHRHTLAAVGAIVALGASIASAQDTTRTRPTSTKRIPVVKESHGEVVPSKVDTVTVYRTDTLTMPGKTDTVTNTVTNTVTKYDTVTQMIPMRIPKLAVCIGALAAARRCRRQTSMIRTSRAGASKA